jgi:DNA-binding transcriptional MerR regulator
MDRVEQIIRDEIEKAKPKYEENLHTNNYVPSVSTEVMKSLGYQGVDVRNISDLDNTWGGSVIYEKSLADQGKPVEKEYPNIQRPPRNFRGQEVLPQWHGPEESKIDDWIYNLQNKQIDTKRVQEAIGDIEENWNVYEKEQLYHGRTASGIRNFLLKELLPVIKEIERLKISPEDIRAYLHNRHAEERNIQMNKINPDIYDPKTGRTTPNPLKDKGSGISTADAQAYLNGLDPARKQILEQIATKFDQMVKGTQQILIDSGNESAETIAKWNKTYKHYVPLFRVEDEMARPSGMGGTASSGQLHSQHSDGACPRRLGILAELST